MIAEGDRVAICGQAWGSLNAADPFDHRWRRPCAWRVRAANDRVSLWQVYSHTKAVFDLL